MMNNLITIPYRVWLSCSTFCRVLINGDINNIFCETHNTTSATSFTCTGCWIMARGFKMANVIIKNVYQSNTIEKKKIVSKKNKQKTNKKQTKQELCGVAQELLLLFWLLCYTYGLLFLQLVRMRILLVVGKAIL